MGKLKNVTVHELEAARQDADDYIGILQDITHRMESNYADHIESPVELARLFSVLARTASHMAILLLAKDAMQEQKAELNKLMAERQALEK